jgi:hypothetical protein
MNEILEKWLAEKQAEKQAEVKRNRKEFLIKLGLVDPTKSTTIYKDVLGNVLTEEEAQARKESGMRVDEHTTYDALDLTEEEYNQVLTYVHPQTSNNGELTDHELLQKIESHTKVVSTILIIYVILSVIVGIIIGVNLG